MKIGFQLAIDPQTVVDRGEKGAIFTFTRCFVHPGDAKEGVSATAIEKFELAGRPYPPGAFENNSMLHKGHYSRIPDPDEKCDMMGIAADMVRIPTDHSPTQEESHGRVARSASLVGNSLNMPTIMLALLILLQLPYPAESKMWSMTHVEEQRFRVNTWQTFR